MYDTIKSKFSLGNLETMQRISSVNQTLAKMMQVMLQNSSSFNIILMELKNLTHELREGIVFPASGKCDT